MANFNKVILAGNLTRDPQLKYLPSSAPVVEFGMAINRRWRSPEGQLKEEVCFVDCTCFGRQAETLNQYMKKGKPIMVEGRLRYEQWDSKDGQKRHRLTVVVEHFQFLTSQRDGQSGPQGGGASSYAPGGYGQQSQSPSHYQAAGAAVAAAGHEPMDDVPDAPPSDDYGPPASGDNIPF